MSKDETTITIPQFVARQIDTWHEKSELCRSLIGQTITGILIGAGYRPDQVDWELRGDTLTITPKTGDDDACDHP